MGCYFGKPVQRFYNQRLDLRRHHALSRTSLGSPFLGGEADIIRMLPAVFVGVAGLHSTPQTPHSRSPSNKDPCALRSAVSAPRLRTFNS